MYLEGVGDKRDIVKATRYLNMACKSGNTYGCEIIKEISEEKPTIKITEVKIPKHEIKEQVAPTNNLKQKIIPQASQQEFQKWEKAGFNNASQKHLSKLCKLGNSYACNMINNISEQKDKKFKKWEDANFKAKDIEFYLSKNISLNEAQKWKNAYFSAKDAYYYINNKISIKEAKLRINKKH